MPTEPADAFPPLLLTEGGPGAALLRRLGIAPLGRGSVRTAAVLATVAWLPLLVLAAIQGVALGGALIPFVYDLAAHVRFLVAVPVLVRCDGVALLLPRRLGRTMKPIVRLRNRVGRGTEGVDDGAIGTDPRAFASSRRETAPRRSLLGVLVLAALMVAPSAVAAEKSGRVAPRAKLEPGQYTWHPETSPKGPVLVVVSLPQQRAYVYRNGILIGRSTISSGREGKETPTGVFTVLQKKRVHESNIYKGAQMPNMQRLTWSGIALHAGKLPGHRASAGCVRLPLEFSRLLFDVTRTGTTVVVADDASDSALVAHPGALMATPSVMKSVKPEDVTAPGWTWNPERATTGPVTVVISGADRQAFVFRNGEPLGRATLTLDAPDYQFPRGVFSYVGETNGERRWIGAGLDENEATRVLRELRTRIGVAPEFLKNVQGILRPGDTLAVTAHSVLPPSLTDTPIE